MKLGIRGKLFAVSVGLIATVGVSCGLYLESELRSQLERRIEDELGRHAEAAVAAMRNVERAAAGPATSPGPATPTGSVESLDALVDGLGDAFDDRITVIGFDGRVLGDSWIATAEVPAMDDHRDRPEVIQALATGRGQSRRYSHTLKNELIYVAVAFERGEHRDVMRASRPLAEIDEAAARLRTVLLLAAGLGLLVAVVMSGLSSHLMSRTLRELARSARAMARIPAGKEPGEETRYRRVRMALFGDDEIGGLAGSINRLAESVESTVAAVASERARLEAVLQGMNEVVIVLDSERSITLVNHAAMALLGVDEAPLGEPLIHHLRVPAIHDLLGESIEPRACEVELAGESPRRMVAQVAPEAENGGCILVMYDVTSIRRLERVRRDFVTNVSHELRTPVSVIRANVETLLDGGAIDDPVHSRRLLDGLSRNAERLSRLLDDLLDLARVEAGRYAIEGHAVSVSEAVANALQSVERVAQQKNIAIHVDVPDDIRVEADDKALDQILVNYLDNAVKYTPESGEVWISSAITPPGEGCCAGDYNMDSEWVRIAVADNGPGIALHHRERVFERFYRVDPGRSRDMGGTGLGLSIVKNLANAMGGDAGVEAHEPRGSYFWVYLPSA